MARAPWAARPIFATSNSASTPVPTPKWTDCGKPGNAIFVMALTVHDGQLFAGICEPGKDETGHVYRYAGDKRWIDCGSPDQSNAVTALAVHDGKLYAGTGHYRLAGSVLPNSLNTTHGGKIFRYDGDGKWVNCGPVAWRRRSRWPGRLPRPALRQLDVSSVRNVSLRRRPTMAASLFGIRWTLGLCTWSVQPLSLRDLHERMPLFIASMAQKWSEPVTLEPKGQSYSLEVHAGELYAGTWPNGHVWRSPMAKPGSMPGAWVRK